MNKKDSPGLHFTVREGQETNLKFTGTPDSNPDLAQTIKGVSQTVLQDELGFLWRTESENFALARSTKVLGLDLPAKLAALSKDKLPCGRQITTKTKNIFVVKTKDGLLGEAGQVVDLEEVQNALWLRADGIAPLSRAYIALKEGFHIKPSHWQGYVNREDGLELIEIPLDDDVVIEKG